jgi:hypothetical protein
VNYCFQSKDVVSIRCFATTRPAMARNDITGVLKFEDKNP